MWALIYKCKERCNISMLTYVHSFQPSSFTMYKNIVKLICENFITIGAHVYEKTTKNWYIFVVVLQRNLQPFVNLT